MKRISAFFIVFVFSVLQIFAQKDIQFSNSNFPGKEREVGIAKQQIKNADILVLEDKYKEALELYKKAYTLNPNNSKLNFDIGYCYYYSPQKYDCLSYFEKAYNLDPKVDKKINFYLGRGYHLNYKFDEAIEFYNKYLQSIKNKEEVKEINKRIAECKYGKELLKDTVKVEIINLGENVNTEYREYSPMVVADGSKIYFTSRRKGTTGGGIDSFDGLYYEDIYETNKTSTGWSRARSVGTPLNTKDHDAVIGLSPDGQQLFVYVNQNSGDIYVSQLRGSKWTKPVSISDRINTEYHETKACISFDNKTLYFISNNPKLTIGGKDIFYSIRDDNEEWSDPINIGSVINTEYDEADVFLHPDGRTLYFSSEGHNSMGGYDIFKTTRTETGEWTKPVNLGYPINTPQDDVFFVTTASGKVAYFASVRPEGFGEHDIYELRYDVDKKIDKPVEERVLVTLVKGTVTDANTKFPIEANIEIIDLTNNKQVALFTTNSQTGKYLINLPSGKNYGINVNKDGYLFYSENFNLDETADFQEFEIDIQMSRIEVGISVILRNIFFDYDKATLQPESYSELNKVVEILKKQPKLKIEISGHTDNAGSLEYNKQLSRERAKTVVDYLIENGINSDRLTYEGYAFEKPITTNDTEEGKALNRRVEFTIISN